MQDQDREGLPRRTRRQLSSSFVTRGHHLTAMRNCSAEAEPWPIGGPSFVSQSLIALALLDGSRVANTVYLSSKALSSASTTLDKMLFSSSQKPRLWQIPQIGLAPSGAKYWQLIYFPRRISLRRIITRITEQSHCSEMWQSSGGQIRPPCDR